MIFFFFIFGNFTIFLTFILSICITSHRTYAHKYMLLKKAWILQEFLLILFKLILESKFKVQ